jgi:hypothetical protein
LFVYEIGTIRGTAIVKRRWRTQSQMEDAMLKRLVIVAAVICTPALAETAPNPAELSKCKPIGQTVKGERIYGLDCAAINNTASVDYKPDMPATNMKETVIPKSGGKQNPDTTPTKGETR